MTNNIILHFTTRFIKDFSTWFCFIVQAFNLFSVSVSKLDHKVSFSIIVLMSIKLLDLLFIYYLFIYYLFIILSLIYQLIINLLIYLLIN